MLKDIHIQVSIDEKGFAFETGKIFRGLTISQVSEGWRITLRAFTRSGGAIYCTWNTLDIQNGFDHLMDALTEKASKVRWHVDRYYQ